MLTSASRLHLKFWVIAAVTLLPPTLFAQSTVPVQIERNQFGETAANEVIVTLKPGTVSARAAAISSAMSIDRAKGIGAGGSHRIHSSRHSTAELMRRLISDPAILRVEPNFIIHAENTPNDPFFSVQWGLYNYGQTIFRTRGTAGADISARAAWDITTGSRNSVVAVIDTGVDYNHPDLSANIWSAPAAFNVNIGGSVITIPAGSHGYNAITRTGDPMDDVNHGTHCAGIVGASGSNSVGITGVNWTASIMPIKFIAANGVGTVADAIDAIEFAVQARQALGSAANVRVLSNSWGNMAYSSALNDEILRAGDAGMLFVVAAGNNFSDNDLSPNYPSSFNTYNMVSVAATDQSDYKAYFSDYGATSVHLGAPGVNIYSTTRNNTYTLFNGTSMACPHVAGAAALMLAANSTLTCEQLKTGLLKTVDPLASLTGLTVTGGRLNLNKAVHWALTPEDFSLSLSSTRLTVLQGDIVDLSVSVHSVNGYADPVGIILQGLPTDVDYTIDANPVAPGGSTVLHITAGVNAVPGVYTIVAAGLGTAGWRYQTFELEVKSAQNFSTSLAQPLRAARIGRTVNFTVNIGSLGGFAGNVNLAVSNLPTGATCTIRPGEVHGSGHFTVVVTASTPPGIYFPVFTATSGTLLHAVSGTLVVVP